MNDTQARFPADFIDRQRRRLMVLRQEIMNARQSRAREQEAVSNEGRDQAHEYEDDAQKLAALDLQDSLFASIELRLATVERALQKLDEGSYGLSDSSLQPIPIERLEATPEALYTLEEQAARDKSG